MTLNNQCATGLYPMHTKITPNNRGDAGTGLFEAQFAPRNVDTSDPQNPRAICHQCNQTVLVKVNPPRRGYFIAHKSSAAGFKRVGDRRSGTPPRTRRT